VNRAFWTILNLVLFAAGAWATWAILRQPSELEPSETGGTGVVFPTREPDTGKKPVAAPSVRPSDELVKTVMAEIDSLWRETLFNPRRTEEIAEENEPAGTAKGPDAFDFELIGIGVIGKRAAAVIWVHRRGVSRARTTPRGRTAAVRSRQRSSGKEKAGKDGPRVYKLGDPVEDTGYTVKEIRLNEVVLVRGDETRVLALDRSDEGSTKRSEAAAREEEKREQARKARLAAASGAGRKPQTTRKKPGAPPPPPPPPPAPVPGAGTTPGAPKPATPSQSYQERIRRALEARRRILEQRRAASGTH